jgi:hypothetical protein
MTKKMTMMQGFEMIAYYSTFNTQYSSHSYAYI